MSTIIQNEKFFKSIRQELREIYSNRSIIRSLVYKNLFGKYKNSFFGFGWHFITPLIMLTLYYITSTQLKTSSIPNYWIFLASSIFPFNYMTANIIGGSSTIVGNSGIVKKMYFPRSIIIIAQIISTFVICIVGYIIVIISIYATGNGPSIITLLTIIPILGSMILFTLGCELIFSSITVYVRDLQYLLNTLYTVLFILTPMYFVAENATGPLGTLIWFNPLTYYVEAYHSILYFGCTPAQNIICACIALPVIFMICGIIIFHKLKRGFAERL